MQCLLTLPGERNPKFRKQWKKKTITSFNAVQVPNSWVKISTSPQEHCWLQVADAEMQSIEAFEVFDEITITEAVAKTKEALIDNLISFSGLKKLEVSEFFSDSTSINAKRRTDGETCQSYSFSLQKRSNSSEFSHQDLHSSDLQGDTESNGSSSLPDKQIYLSQRAKCLPSREMTATTKSSTSDRENAFQPAAFTVFYLDIDRGFQESSDSLLGILTSEKKYDRALPFDEGALMGEAINIYPRQPELLLAFFKSLILWTKWVFKYKRTNDQFIYKNRLTVQGFKQIKYNNFDKTLSPVLNKNHLRMIRCQS